MIGPYWTVVKANVTDEGRPSERELSRWWSEEHVPLYVARDGFVHGQRLKTVEAEGQLGGSLHEYLAIYQVDAVGTFNEALAAGPPWGPWDAQIDRYLKDWERTYYRFLAVHEADAGRGRFRAIVKVDLTAEDPAAEAAFQRWYTETHVPEICSYEGVHRAWRLQMEPDGNDLGPRRQRFWTIYEVSEPAAFAAARADRATRGVEPWDGIWLPHVSNFEITFHELLYEIDHDAAAELELAG